MNRKRKKKVKEAQPIIGLAHYQLEAINKAIKGDMWELDLVIDTAERERDTYVDKWYSTQGKWYEKMAAFKEKQVARLNEIRTELRERKEGHK